MVPCLPSKCECRTVNKFRVVQSLTSFTEHCHVPLSGDIDVLLTVRLSIFILVINQLDAQNLFYSKFISCLYMFRAPFTHRQEQKIVLYSLWYHHTCR